MFSGPYRNGFAHASKPQSTASNTGRRVTRTTLGRGARACLGNEPHTAGTPPKSWSAMGHRPSANGLLANPGGAVSRRLGRRYPIQAGFEGLGLDRRGRSTDDDPVHGPALELELGLSANARWKNRSQKPHPRDVGGEVGWSASVPVVKHEAAGWGFAGRQPGCHCKRPPRQPLRPPGMAAGRVSLVGRSTP